MDNKTLRDFLLDDYKFLKNGETRRPTGLQNGGQGLLRVFLVKKVTGIPQSDCCWAIDQH